MIGSFPKTYREKYWGALASYIVMVLVLWANTYRAAPYLIYAFPALFLFMIVNLVATRLVLYEDRIESINLITRRSLRREEIDRLEVRETRGKSGIEKNYFLISKDGLEKPLMVPGTIKMDQDWFDWMAPIREMALPPPEVAASPGAALAPFVITAALVFPIFKHSAKPYFDVLHLFLPWLVCLYVFTSGRIEAQGKSALWIMMVFGVSPIYLVVFCQLFGTFVVGADMWVPILAALVMSLLSLALVRRSPIDSLCVKRDWLVMVPVFAAIYGYGAAVTADQLFDLSKPQYALVPVASKYVVTGKGAGSFFKLAPWGAETMVRSYQPGRGTYDRLKVGDTVCAALHSGALGMRWYQLSDTCPRTP